MNNRPPELDMTLDGEFRTPPKPPLLTRVLVWAIIVAVVACAVTLAALLLGVALMVLPVAIGAAAAAWLLWRFQMWRAGGRIGPRPGNVQRY